MGFEIAEQRLSSRIERNKITKDGKESRKIGKSLNESRNESKGIIAKIFSIFSGFGGFLLSKVKQFLSKFQINWSTLWGFVVTGAIALLNFNWNQTDAELDGGVKNGWIAFASSLGGATGTALGYFLCGFTPTIPIFAVNEAKAVYLSKTLGEEFLDEMAGQMSNVIGSGLRALAATAFAYTYKNIRKMLKKPNSFARLILGDKVINNWGKPGGEAWTFAKAIEDQVERIPNPFIRGFVEELLEEFGEACIEAGYVLTGGLDSWAANQKMTKNQIIGPNRIVEIQPNREVENETILMGGAENILRPAMVQTMANYKLLDNKDVGQIIGQPVDDYVSQSFQPMRLIIKYYSLQTPPWKAKRGERLNTATYKIPNIERKSIDFEKIKLAAGGSNGISTGKYYANARLTDGFKMLVYGSSEKGAINTVKGLAKLSQSEILTISTGKREKEGKAITQPGLIRDSDQLYPAYATIFIKSLDPKTGRAYIDGIKRKELSYRIELWRPQKPPEFDEAIRGLFSGKEEF